MKAPREGGESAALHGSLPEPHALLFHITTLTAWERARAAGVYTAPSMDDVGFIHLSLDRQWPGARARFFAGVSGLVLLVIDPTRLTGELRFEPADGDTFPHLYAPLNVDAVVDVRALDAEPDQ